MDEGIKGENASGMSSSYESNSGRGSFGYWPSGGSSQGYGSNTGQSGNFKRSVAFKLKIGQIMGGNQIFDLDKLSYIEINNRRVQRVNIIANVIDKYLQEGEKNYGTATLDDASGQIKIKVFGEELAKIKELNQGDTVLVIGMLRSWNNEVYVMPEIIKKKDPKYLFVRKLETDLDMPKEMDRDKIAMLRDNILDMIKKAEEAGGINSDKLIIDLKESPDVINSEIKKLLEDGAIYEPRPGKLRYLG